MSQLSLFYTVEKEVEYASPLVWGGAENCERCMVRFGSPEQFGYDELFPITLLRCAPVQKKFSDTLTHRDFLGSVIGLGIDRAKIGDIVVRDNEENFKLLPTEYNDIFNKQSEESMGK